MCIAIEEIAANRCGDLWRSRRNDKLHRPVHFVRCGRTCETCELGAPVSDRISPLLFIAIRNELQKPVHVHQTRVSLPLRCSLCTSTCSSVVRVLRYIFKLTHKHHVRNVPQHLPRERDTIDRVQQNQCVCNLFEILREQAMGIRIPFHR